MKTLPADVARCGGYRVAFIVKSSSYLFGEYVDHSTLATDCLDCLRRTAAPIDHPWVAHMGPPKFEAGKCEMKIAE